MNYKDRLQELREYYNFSQREIAEKIQLTKSAYNQYEQQYRIIPVLKLNDIANVFNVSINYLLNISNDKTHEKSYKNLDIIKSGIRLKEFRKSINYTQKKLSDKLNIATSLISDYEKGTRFISTHALYTICKKHNISADYLLGKTDSPKYLK